MDLSPAGISNARLRFRRAGLEPFTLLVGGVETLEQWPPDSFDAILLSNILDNLYPQDAMTLLSQCHRLLRPRGRILVKLNPWLSPEQIQTWGIQVLEDNLLDDGLLLWNNTDRQWRTLMEAYFTIREAREIYYPEFDQINRLILAEKI